MATQTRSLQYSRSLSSNSSRGDRERGGGGDRGGGGAPSHLLLMELKHRILAALNKLSDRDTHHLAVEDLHRIAEMLSPDGIAMCLSCICDTDAPQKSAAKKECVKMFGTLALLHGCHLLPHLPKIVASILRRLKDPDSSVREACVDAMGVLSSALVSVSDNPRGPLPGPPSPSQQWSGYGSGHGSSGGSCSHGNADGSGSSSSHGNWNSSSNGNGNGNGNGNSSSHGNGNGNGSSSSNGNGNGSSSSNGNGNGNGSSSSNGNGNGNGNGNSYSHGNGNGNGNGNSYSHGNGNGNGNGNSYSHGNGNGNGNSSGHGNGTGGCMQELTAFVKPIFDALYEQNRNLQSGAASCLARVISTIKGSPQSGSMARLCQRVCKLLTNPCFASKSTLLPVISSLAQLKARREMHVNIHAHISFCELSQAVYIARIAQLQHLVFTYAIGNLLGKCMSCATLIRSQQDGYIGAINQQSTINTMVPCVHEALESSDWATRKAAAETLMHIGSTLAPHLLTAFKSPTLLLLESCRFDKVKPVRDCVQDAIQTWKALHGSEKERAGSMAITTSNGGGNSRLSDTTHRKIAGILKKRGVVFADKIPNPDFFNKLEKQNLNDWHVEVAVPRNCPPPPRTSDKSTEVEAVVLTELKEETGKLSHDFPDETNSRNRSLKNEGFYGEDGKLCNIKSTKAADQDLLETLDHISAMRLAQHEKDGGAERSRLIPQTADSKNSNINLIDDHFAQCKTSTCLSSTIPVSEAKASTDPMEQLKQGHGENWMAIQRQLSQLEFQQGALMDLLQEFMGNSKNSMLALESRMKVLERVVEDFVTEDLDGSASDCIERYNNGVGKHRQMENGPKLLSLEEEYSMHSNITRQMVDFMTRDEDIETDQTSSDWDAKANDKMGKWEDSAKEVHKWTASFDRGHLHSRIDVYNRGNLSVTDDEVCKELPGRHDITTDEEEYFMNHIDRGYEQSRVHAEKLSSGLRSEDEDSRDTDFVGEDALDLRNAPARWDKGLLTGLNGKGNGSGARESKSMSKGRFEKGPRQWDDSDHEEAEKISAVSGPSAANRAGLEEGPSARSVWQATKDEATLAAIRAGSTTGQDQQCSARAKNNTSSPTKGSSSHRGHSNAVTEDSQILRRTESLTHDSAMEMWDSTTHQAMSAYHDDVQGQVMKRRNTDGQTAEKRAYWKLWSRVMELVQADDIDSAYLEVLGSGDELMIVRLMNKTGPVLDKLSAHTANEMLHTVALLLRQHGFFDFGLPWLQQVADLIVEMGPSSLDILTHVKDELLESIQEAGHMESPAGSFGNSVSELSSILTKAWSNQQGTNARET